jgi:beta-aspartyl-peptidase (threonine type)
MHTLRLFWLLLSAGVLLSTLARAQHTAPGQPVAPGPGWVLVIHGGAGGPPKGSMSPALEMDYLHHLDSALLLGKAILDTGGSALDAVESVVRYMEDCPLFNAGKGAVLDAEGRARLDASVMDGLTGSAGAVASVSTIRNPVSAARLVMEQTPHVLLVDDGADEFAATVGLERVDPDYFITPAREEAWKRWREKRDRDAKENKDEKGPGGTVGAVALDAAGNLAAATSTGGMMGKMAGRVGDSPLIGAGTWASNRTCAVSATGHGEFFIRNVVAYDVSALMEYLHLPLKEAAHRVIMEKLEDQKAGGGLIAVDREGHIAMPFNTNAMFRGYVRANGETMTAIY